MFYIFLFENTAVNEFLYTKLFQASFFLEMVRVRQLLDSLSTKEKNSLKKLLPANAVPECETHKYPSALMTVLTKNEEGYTSYSMLGCIVEELLKMDTPTQTTVTFDELITCLSKEMEVTTAIKEKLRKSKTTQPFLDHISKTRQKLAEVAKLPLSYDQCIEVGSLQGHPDIIAENQIFEVKTTGQLAKNWPYFMLQLFSYGALSKTASNLYLILPLQELVVHFSTSTWTKREQFLAFLLDICKNRYSSSAETDMGIMVMNYIVKTSLVEQYRIGFHIKKEKTLKASLAPYAGLTHPFQLFLSNMISTHVNVSDMDIAETSQFIDEHKMRIFVHSPYIINLCMPKSEKDGYHIALLKKNLVISNSFGSKGVVVHTGKSLKVPLITAIQVMKDNILDCLSEATEECPLLLETPAGQGTETLTKIEDFVKIFQEIPDKRFGMCIDTCHIYASGYDPEIYIRKIKEYGLFDRLKLLHFNDSSTQMGSCVDRHAALGEGKIGIEKLETVAHLCGCVPMLRE